MNRHCLIASTLSACCIMMTVSTSQSRAQETPIFKPDTGIVDFYAEHREPTPIYDKYSCPPGVSDIAGTPCGGGGAAGPINPCGATSSCGPAVGLDGGLIKLPPEKWNIQDYLKQ
ncbi:hypothetical protein NKI38_30340 [Mesorhizobium sp. M0621]|uniref:hypothetical protein n=1 Tax=unclassified Mesorhizobium TaxID=325217 RepID=UPI00333C9C2A